MPETRTRTWKDWLSTPLDLNTLTLDTLEESHLLNTMPRGGLIEGFIPGGTGYNGVTPTLERTCKAIRYLLEAKENGHEIKTQFYSWAAIIAYAGNLPIHNNDADHSQGFEGIRSKLDARTERSLQTLREKTVTNLQDLIEKAPVDPDNLETPALIQLYRWLASQHQQNPESAHAAIFEYLTGKSGTIPDEKTLQQTAEGLYPAYNDNCFIAAPDGAMLDAQRRMLDTQNLDSKKTGGELYKNPYDNAPPSLTATIQRILKEEGTSLEELRNTGRELAYRPPSSWEIRTTGKPTEQRRYR